MYNRRFEVNEEHTAAFLDNAVNNVKSDYDVDSLAELAKLFKKNVPFSLRKYVMAYLLREALKHDHYRPGRFDRNAKRNDRRDYSRGESHSENRESDSEERQSRPRVEIPEDQSTTIFMSIGRNRRVFPRDLVSLLINVGGIERERIGNIKVLANYSFVQLYTEDTEKAIQSLNDYEYRGRKLVVNLSRQKSDVEGEEAEEAEDQVEDSQVEAMSEEDAAAYAAAEKAASNEGFGA